MLRRQTRHEAGWRWARPLSGAAVALAAGIAAAHAQSDAAAKARTVFETHCARCHQTGRLENPPAKGGLGNILDLGRLTERDDLVVPSDPDASRLYQIMLARHRPLPVFFGPLPGPTPAEIGLVRDWLSDLPPRSTACAGKPPVTPSDVTRDIAAWRKAFETDASKPLRFISLANLHNLCRSDATIAAYRDAVAALVNRLTLRNVSTLDTIGEASVLLAFRPSDFGLTAEAWDLRTGSGDESKGVVAAEALAARALAAATPAAAGSTGGGAIAQAVAAPAPQDLFDGLDPVEALAREYTRPVTLDRAAIEVGLDDRTLRERLSALSGDDRVPALRLAQTGLPRAEWEDVRSKITGTQSRVIPREARSDGSQLTLSLWTDALSYKTGDLLTVQARPSGDCNLTVVAVEADGLATVLYPNDTTIDNRVQAGGLVQIPADGAPFQLRLDKPGRHTLVAICNASAKRPQGIGHDFERQRFTVLGDWRTFLLQSVEREADYQKTQEDLRKFRTGAGGAEVLHDQLPQGTEDEARAALSVTVE